MFLTNVIDQTMLAGMEGLMQGGIYAIMMYMVSAMLIPYRSMVKVATPVVTNLWKERDMAGMQRIHRDVSLMNLIVGCFFFPRDLDQPGQHLLADARLLLGRTLRIPFPGTGTHLRNVRGPHGE